MEVLPAALDGGRVLLVAVEVGVDELDEAVEVLGRHLEEGIVRWERLCVGGCLAYRFVLLVKVVDVAVEDLDEELDGGCRLHTGVGHTQSSLQTLKDTLAVAVQLQEAG